MNRFVAVIICGGSFSAVVFMKRVRFLCGLLLLAWSSLAAQDWTSEDSLRLRQLMDGEGEIRLNRRALKDLEQIFPLGQEKVSEEKPWLDFDSTLPTIHQKKKVRLTLYPYTPTTPYNWDPVLQCKIDIDAPDWKKNLMIWLHTQPVGSASPSGISFMAIFTREFWNRKIGRRRARTLEALRAYGDSVTVHLK